MGVVEFYKRLLEASGLRSKEDDYVYIRSYDVDHDIIVAPDSIPLVLPTKEHINSVYLKDEDTGEILKTKTLFHPLFENAIGESDSLSITILKKCMRSRIAVLTHALGTVILDTLHKNEKDTNISMLMSTFAMNLSERYEGSNRNKKSLFTSTISGTWDKVINTALTRNGTQYIVDIILGKNNKNQKTVEGESYIRSAKYKSNLLEDLEKIQGYKSAEERKLFDISIGKDALFVLIELIKFLIAPLDQESKNFEGSNDAKAPAFHALFKAYLPVAHRLNELIKEFEPYMGDDLFEKFYIPKLITYEDIKNEIIKCNTEMSRIPKDTDTPKIAGAKTEAKPYVEPPREAPRRQAPREERQEELSGIERLKRAASGNRFAPPSSQSGYTAPGRTRQEMTDIDYEQGNDLISEFLEREQEKRRSSLGNRFSLDRRRNNLLNLI